MYRLCTYASTLFSNIEVRAIRSDKLGCFRCFATNILDSVRSDNLG